MRRGILLAACAAALFALAAQRVWAQPPVQVGVEVARDRSTWHFENPSRFDTDVNVPHFFEQHYVLDNVWLTALAQYRAGIDWRTSVGVTPMGQALATDYDTFFDPDNVVWVSGTTGDARMHSLRFAQEVELERVHGIRLSGGYRLRVDFADFLDGDKTDTRNGRVIAGSVVTTREYTSGQTQAVYVRATHERELSARLRLRVAGEMAPAAVNRLAIRLPDKYPGQTIVFRTTNIETSGQVALESSGTGWPIALTLQAGRSWNYRTAQRVQHTTLALGVSAGRTW